MSSSQSFAPLSRMLWKEYRSQRSLWLAVLACGIFPQLLLRVLMSDAADRYQAIWVMAALMPHLFAVGSTAILFAGEREERTSDWLLQMSAPPIWILFAKWGFALLATAALAGALALSAMALDRKPPSADSLTSAVTWLWVTAGILLWGGLGSLLCRRVVTSVPVMGFWWVMTMLVPVAWLPGLFGIQSGDAALPRWQTILQVLAFVAVGLADLILGWCWSRGWYLDGQWLDGLTARLARRTAWIPRWARVATRLPLRAEPDSDLMRQWQRLVWHERHRESYQRSLLLLGCLVAGVLGGIRNAAGGSLLPGVLPMLAAFPLAMGVLGFRHEGQGATRQFLSQRGVSPRMIWLVKHRVWVPRAVWMPLMIWGVGCGVEALLGHSSRDFPGLGTPGVLPFLCGYGLLSYGCGQLAGLLVRRVVLAIGAGVVLNLLALLWLSSMSTLQVPQVLSVAPLVAALWATTWWGMPSWLHGRWTWRGSAGLMAANLGVVLLMTLAIGVWRLLEVAVIRQMAMPGAYGEPGDAVPAPVDSKFLEMLSWTRAGYNTALDFQQEVGQGPALAERRFWDENSGRLKALEAGILAAAPQTRIPHDPQQGVGTVIPPHQQLLLEAARLKSGAGDLAAAEEYLWLSWKLAGFWARGGGAVAYREGADQQAKTLQALLVWGSHEAQTPELLAQALGRLQREAAEAPTAFDAVTSQYQEDRQWLADRLEYRAGSRPQGHVSDHGWQSVLTEAARYFPWEQSRAEMLLSFRKDFSTMAVQSLSQAQMHPGMDPQEMLHLIYREARDKLNPVWQTTPLVAWPIHSDDQAILHTSLEHESALRETVVSLALLHWRAVHDDWPVSLGLLMTDDALPLNPRWSIDPWNGELLQYTRPEDAGVARPGQVLLWSVGPQRLREVYVTHEGRPEPATLYASGFESTLGKLGTNRVEFEGGGLRLKTVNAQPVRWGGW